MTNAKRQPCRWLVRRELTVSLANSTALIDRFGCMFSTNDTISRTVALFSVYSDQEFMTGRNLLEREFNVLKVLQAL